MPTRLLRTRSPFFWHFARTLGPWVLGVIVYVWIATMIVRWDMQRSGEQVTDFGAELYGIYMQLFFEPTMALPQAPIARAIFWITPLLGAVLIARGVLRVGESLFDPVERHRLWIEIMTKQMRDHIVVCGLGHVGGRVVEALSQLGVSVVAIERSKDEGFGEKAESLGAVVLYGDARNDELLHKAGIARAKAVVCATDDDLTNLEVAIDSKRENPEIRVIMRMFDQRVASKMRAALDVDETFSTSALAGPLVALQATEPGVRGVYRLADGTLRVDMEVPVPSGWVGRDVASCEDALDARVVAVRSGQSEQRRARHDTVLAAGDIVVLDLPASQVARLHR